MLASVMSSNRMSSSSAERYYLANTTFFVPTIIILSLSRNVIDRARSAFLALFISPLGTEWKSTFTSRLKISPRPNALIMARGRGWQRLSSAASYCSCWALPYSQTWVAASRHRAARCQGAHRREPLARRARCRDCPRISAELSRSRRCWRTLYQFLF